MTGTIDHKMNRSVVRYRLQQFRFDAREEGRGGHTHAHHNLKARGKGLEGRLGLRLGGQFQFQARLTMPAMLARGS